MAEVTRADRAMAVDILRAIRFITAREAQAILDGKHDGHEVVAVAARHRSEAVKPLVEALEKIAENDTDGLHMYTPQAMQEIALAALRSAQQ